MEKIEGALQQFEAAASLEERLDFRRRRLVAVARDRGETGLKQLDAVVDDFDAALAAGTATDHYLAACASLMGVLPKFVGEEKVQKLLADNIAFMMARIEQLQVLLQRQGSATKHVSYTKEELMQQRDRARISQPTQSDETKRHRVAREILESERSYVMALESLLKYYIVPLTRGFDPIIDSNEKSVVFGNIEEILGLAHSFLQALEEKLKNWSPKQTLGDIFKSHAMFFKIYVLYTNMYKDGITTAIELLKRNPDAKSVATLAAKAGCQDIASLMINPIQRLPRYVLLLKELRKRTSDEHPDARLLESALADIQVVADHVNERLRSHESNAKLLEIQNALWTSRLGGVPVTLLAPGRTFVREGKMLKVRSTNTFREVHVFLFTDIFLYCTSSRMWPGRYHYHNHLEFYGASPCPGEVKARGLSHPKLENAFKVTSAQAMRVFIPDTFQERNVWIDLINKCAEDKKALDIRRRSSTNLHSSQRTQGTQNIDE